MLTGSALRRLALAAATYAAALLICGVALLLGEKSHTASDLVASALLFPVGLAHATDPLFRGVSPGPLAPFEVIYIIYGVFLVALVCTANRKTFWALYAVFALLMIVNTGGCVAINAKVGL